MVSEKIVIKASPEHIFEAIRKQRSNAEKHRHLQSYDGKVAVVKEELHNVPVYGKVECVWQETEQEFERIDFKMLSSSKFKESHGAWIVTKGKDNQSTTLELQAHMDAGLNIPFAAEMTKASTSKDSKARLEEIKKAAEDIAKSA
ncbi:MAG: SRPBCC family protein, partial [Candidatus Obscuribacterales bacterium]|nr:SRPBCC family protein [Candidatus Obscuribacterales bacterium]